MLHPRLVLIIGICCVSIFPVLVKLAPVNEITSAFYRLFFAAILFFVLSLGTRKLRYPGARKFGTIVVCGILFASDITVWNKSIELSSATQASLLTNLAPVWVGIGAYFFLKDKPKRNFWIGTVISLVGMVILMGWEYFFELQFDAGFILAIISSLIYAFYIIASKRILNEVNVINFMFWNMLSASVFLFLLTTIFGAELSGFSTDTWWYLVLQGVVCQFIGWLCISFALKNMRANRVSVSLLLSVVFTALFAWYILSEPITTNMIIGGMIVLLGIGVTFIERKSKSII